MNGQYDFAGLSTQQDQQSMPRNLLEGKLLVFHERPRHLVVSEKIFDVANSQTVLM